MTDLQRPALPLFLKLADTSAFLSAPRIVMGLVYISFPLYVMATKPFAGFAGSKSRLSRGSGLQGLGVYCCFGLGGRALMAYAFDGCALASSDPCTTKIRKQQPYTWNLLLSEVRHQDPELAVEHLFCCEVVR